MPKFDILIRRFGNLIDVSADGKQPMPSEAKSILEKNLTYTYMQRLYGYAKRKDPITGHVKSLILEPRALYRYDSLGRLVCGGGLVGRVTDLLKKAGFKVAKLDKTKPPEKRPDRYFTDWQLVDETFTYRPRQRECVEKIANAKNGCGVISAATGFGKGVIIAMLCLLFRKAKIHIVVPGSDLIRKTICKLSEYVPDVGQVGLGKKHVSRVTVFSADSLHLSDGDADILIVDEGHELMAPTYSRELAKYRFSRNFCFTATPEGRSDNADFKMESLFGQVIFELTYQEAVSLNLVVPIETHWIDLISNVNPAAGKTEVYKKRYGIWRNCDRNKAFADRLQEYLDDQILVLVETIEHAVHLKQYLPNFELCYDKLTSTDRHKYIKSGLLKETEPLMTPTRRERMRLDFESGKLKHVISTSVWAQGVSFDALPVLVWAGGGASKIKSTQIPGRVCRIFNDKQVGIFIDCCDQFDDSFARNADLRHKYYVKHGWKQVYSDGRKTRRKRAQF